MTESAGSLDRGKPRSKRGNNKKIRDRNTHPPETPPAARAEIERMRAEFERRLAAVVDDRNVFDRLMDSMTEALFVLDVEGRVIRVNEAGRSMLSRSDDEILGRAFSVFEPGNEIPASPHALLRIDPAGRPIYAESSVRNSGGHAVPISVSATMVRDSAGLVTGLLLMARDISDRVAVEHALAHKAKELARSNEELQRFASVASHDLQEPLRTVTSFVQLLQSRYGEKLDSDAIEFIGFAMDGARRMQRLIDGLLAYAHVQTQANPFAPTPCEVALSQAKANLHLAIKESGAVITNDPLPIVVADQAQLVQLFQNLVGNAIKYRNTKAPEIHIATGTEKTEWFFSVRDNGIGIDMKFAQRIFVVFQRLHTVDEYPGTGIGLSICKRIVERHGGRIWVESAPGSGCTFSFTLSRAPG